MRSTRAAGPGNAKRIACISRSPGGPDENARPRAEMEEAARDALKALGMENAKAIFVAHNDEDYAHVHIVASQDQPSDRPRLRPRKELAHAVALGGAVRAGAWRRYLHSPRRTLNELRDAIADRDAGAVLEAMTKQRSTFTCAAARAARSAKKSKTTLNAASSRRRSSTRPELVELADQIGGPVTRYTTRTVLEAEQHVLQAAERARRQQRPSDRPERGRRPS